MQAVAAESTVKGSTTDLSQADDSPGGIAAAAAALTGKGLHVVWPDKVGARGQGVRGLGAAGSVPAAAWEGLFERGSMLVG